MKIIGTFQDSKSIPKNHHAVVIQQRASTLGNVLYISYPIRIEII